MKQPGCTFSGRFLVVLLCLAVLLSLVGCREERIPETDPAEATRATAPPSIDEPMEGGTTYRRDEDAPKEIRSKDLTELHVEFMLYGEWSPGNEDAWYCFELTPEADGSITATESTLALSLPADQELTAAVQEIIDRYDLVQKNGVYDVTAGLPPEFWPGSFRAVYASGEVLYFTEDNSPDADWARAMYMVFADWFAAQGEPALLPPETDYGPVDHIRIHLRENRTITTYSVVTVSEQMAIQGERQLFRKDVYDETLQQTTTEQYARVPADFYDRVTEILSHYDLRPFDDCSVLYGTGRNGLNADDRDYADLQLHLEFETGHRLNIDTNDPDDFTLLRPIMEELFTYYDSIFE